MVPWGPFLPSLTCSGVAGRSLEPLTGRVNRDVQLPKSLPDRAHAGVRAQRRLHLASARRAGGAAHAVAGRKRCRCRRRRRGDDDLRAGRAAWAATPSRSCGTARAAWPQRLRRRRRRPGRRRTSGASTATTPRIATAQARHRTRSPFPARSRGWVALNERFGKLPFADLLQPGHRDRRARLPVPRVVQQKWAAATPELGAQPGFAKPSCPGAAPAVGELFQFPAAARALRPSPRPRARLLRGRDRRRSSRIAAPTAARSTATTSPATGPSGSSRSASYRGYTLHEIPPNGQGIAALIALGILQNFDLAAHAGRRRRFAAPADRGDEARLRRRLPLRGRGLAHGSHRRRRCSTTPTSPAAPS